MNINLDDLAVEKASSVIANPYDLGTVVAEEAKKNLPEDANVVVLLGPSGKMFFSLRMRTSQSLMSRSVTGKNLKEWNTWKTGCRFMMM